MKCKNCNQPMKFKNRYILTNKLSKDLVQTIDIYECANCKNCLKVQKLTNVNTQEVVISNSINYKIDKEMNE